MRRAFARALIIPVLFAVPLLSGCQSKADKLVYQANETAKKALESDPDTREKLLEQARADLQEAVKLDPNNENGYRLLGQLDEVLGHPDDAAKDFMAASALDPTDQKLMQKARMYKAVQELVDNASKSIDQIKSGDVDGGMKTLKDALVATHSKYTRDKVTAVLQQAIPLVIQQGDQQVKDKKYPDAIKTYDQAVRGYMMLAEAQGKHTLDSAADTVLHSINEAAKDGGTPDATFRVLNDVLTVDPDNKTANMELAQVYLRRTPPDYDTAADLEERAGAPDADVKKLRDMAKKHHKG